MAHVLVWYEEGVVRHIVKVIAEEELDHTATVASSFLEALAILRTSLRPLVVVYDGCLLRDLTPEEVEALDAQRATLRQHQYVATSTCFSPLPASGQEVVADLGTEWLYMPWEVTSLIAFIERAAARLANVVPGGLSLSARAAYGGLCNNRMMKSATYPMNRRSER